jgi:hypothetical protein
MTNNRAGEQLENWNVFANVQLYADGVGPNHETVAGGSF